MLRRQPALTAVAVFALSLGIPIGLLPFHVGQALTRTLPFDRGERIVRLEYVDAATSAREPMGLRDAHAWRDGLSSYQALGMAMVEPRNLVDEDGGAAPLTGSAVTASTFDIVRVAPFLGRPLVQADERLGAPDVMLIGYDLWQGRFGGDPQVVGRSVRLGGVPHEVVGVMPKGFEFPYHDAYWVPLRWNPLGFGWGAEPYVMVFGRLRDGVSFAQANDEIQAVRRRLADEVPESRATGRARVVPFAGTKIYSDPSFWSQEYLALLLLGVACGNVGILILARTAARSGEIAVRMALGANRARIVSQVFLEALVLALIGAGVGLALAEVAARQVEAALDLRDLPFWYDFGVTWQTALVALGLAVLSATLAGILPALRATGRDINRGLQRASAGASGIRFGGLSSALIIAEVALASGFMGVGGQILPAVLRDPGAGLGIEASEFLVAGLQLSWGSRYAEEGPEVRKAGLQELGVAREALVARVAAEPGVGGVTVASRVPGGDYPIAGVEVEGDERAVYRVRQAGVGVDYFRTLNQRVLQGRDFTGADIGSGASEGGAAVIVNASFVTQVLGGGNPIGRRFRRVASAGAEPGPWWEIVGVVGPLGMNVANPAEDAGYYQPTAARNGYLIVHAADGHPVGLAGSLRRIAAQIDPRVMVMDATPLDAYLKRSGKRLRVFWGGVLVVMIAGVAVVLSAAGLYALVSFTVSQRRREIGIRTALGARIGHLAWTIARRALLQISGGIALGLLLRLLVVSEMRVPMEATTHAMGPKARLLLTTAVILAVGLGACIPPLLRALRVPPSEALGGA